jgi:hypothetical protein
MNIAHQRFIICTLQVRLRRTPGQAVLQGYMHLYKGLQLRMNLYRSTITCDSSESSRMQRHPCNSTTGKEISPACRSFTPNVMPFIDWVTCHILCQMSIHAICGEKTKGTFHICSPQAKYRSDWLSAERIASDE